MFINCTTGVNVIKLFTVLMSIGQKGRRQDTQHKRLGIMPFGIMAFSIVTFGITVLSIKTSSKTIFSTTVVKMLLA